MQHCNVFALLLLLLLLLHVSAARNLIPVPPGDKVYFGSYSGAAWYMENAKSEMTSLENKVGRKMDIDRIYHIFNERFPFDYHRWTVSQGRIPMISLVPITVTNGVRARIPWSDITAGKWDSYLRDVGTRIKDWKTDFFFCFHHEPDLDATCPGNTLQGCDLTRWHGTSGQFVQAFAYIRALWDSMGVNTVTYVWIMTQMNWSSNLAAATRYYPGSSVVDWIDMYNFISDAETFTNWAPFVNMASSWYAWASKTGLPLALAEYGCREYRPDPSKQSTWRADAKAQWFRDSLPAITQNMPKLKALVYFHKDQNPRNWRADSTQESLGGFNTVARASLANWWKSGSGPGSPTKADYRISFQPSSVAAPAGYTVDSGKTYGSRNGLTYGWNRDASSTARQRNSVKSPSVLYDTLVHMQLNGVSYTWEIAVPNGAYIVKLVAGDPEYTGTCYSISLEGKLAMSGCSSSAAPWISWTGAVTVSDGRLTVSNTAGHSSSNRLNFIEISTAAGTAVKAISTVAITRSESSAAADADDAVSEEGICAELAAQTGEAPERFQLLHTSSNARTRTQTFNVLILDSLDHDRFTLSSQVARNLTSRASKLTGLDHIELATDYSATESSINPPEPWITRWGGALLVAATCAFACTSIGLAIVIVYLARRLRHANSLPTSRNSFKEHDVDLLHASPAPSQSGIMQTAN